MSASLYSWGRYPAVPQTSAALHWQDDIAQVLEQSVMAQGTVLPYGQGRSYGDSCLSVTDHVIHMRGLRRILSADWERGVLRVEAGATLAELLALMIPKGWFLPVTPGTRFVTVGGAIANDVHGKNHHRRGTFGCHVARLGLWREGGLQHCSAQHNPELFSATVGGLGLTGIVLWAELQLVPINASQIHSKTQRFDCLEDFFALSNEWDPSHEYSVAWVDCLARGAQKGRGVFMAGDHAPYGSLQVDEPERGTVPFTPPISLINQLSLRAFNTAYWHKHSKRMQESCISYEPFFYPLDRLLHWNRIYGRQGFQQYQCVLPESVAQEALAELLEIIAHSGQGSFLAVLKRCGDMVSPGLLSFPLAGTSLALDFPQSANLQPLFRRLDALVSEAGGRLYPAKDAHMSAADFQKAYPAWEALERLRDPILNSRFWKRVTA